MRVLIVGSLNHREEDASTTDFADACRAIGAQLATEGIELVVGSSGARTADKYILEGAASVPGTHKVWVYRTEDGETPIMPQTDTNKTTLTCFYKRLRGPWAAGRVPQIQAADAILLIGGARGTAQVGYAAAALGRPALAVGGFGGAAEELWPQLQPFYERAGRIADEIGNLREKWKPEYAELTVRALKILVRRGVFKRSNTQGSALTLILNIFLFTAWVWLFVDPPIQLHASIFALLAVSAFLGTALRVALRGVLDPAEQKTAEVVLAELSAGLVLAFALAMLYLAGSFTFTGKFQPFANVNEVGEDYRRVAVGMTVIGIAGGWLLERVAERLTRSFGQRLAEDDEDT